VSRKTVAASLRRQGLAGICPRRFAPATTVVDLHAVVPKHLVGRRCRARNKRKGVRFTSFQPAMSREKLIVNETSSNVPRLWGAQPGVDV
jgi:hypothetical protein